MTFHYALDGAVNLDRFAWVADHSFHTENLFQQFSDKYRQRIELQLYYFMCLYNTHLGVGNSNHFYGEVAAISAFEYQNHKSAESFSNRLYLIKLYNLFNLFRFLRSLDIGWSFEKLIMDFRARDTNWCCLLLFRNFRISERAQSFTKVIKMKLQKWYLNESQSRIGSFELQGKNHIMLYWKCIVNNNL